MNRLEFRIDDWIPGDDPDPRRAETSAEFVLLVNDVSMTKLYDSWSRTVTDRARLPLYPLAEWLAVNWWRIHTEAPFEAGGLPPAQWRLSHDLTGIGGGLVWPQVRFASDDVSIQVSARAFPSAPWEPVRYINDVPPTAIAPDEFDRASDAFIGNVLARLETLGVSAEPLTTIWEDVRTERADKDLSEWRLWEARLGYDPDQAPERLMEQLAGLFDRAGRKAAAEVVPLMGADKLMTLKRIESLARAPGMDIVHAGIRYSPSQQGPPWEIGRAFAHEIRKSIPAATGPLDDSVLLDLLGAPANAFERLAPMGGPLSLGVRSADERKATLHFRKRNRPGMRFEAARFLAEALTADADDLWLPLTDRGTARQKMQRAFAAEFLTPINEIHDLIGDEYTIERFEEVGDRYGVSALAVRSHLANHGFLSPEDVTAISE